MTGQRNSRNRTAPAAARKCKRKGSVAVQITAGFLATETVFFLDSFGDSYIQ